MHKTIIPSEKVQFIMLFSCFEKLNLLRLKTSLVTLNRKLENYGDKAQMFRTIFKTRVCTA